jgi:hypothetical protein
MLSNLELSSIRKKQPVQVRQAAGHSEETAVAGFAGVIKN